jgi:hypothetical protein
MAIDFHLIPISKEQMEYEDEKRKLDTCLSLHAMEYYYMKPELTSFAKEKASEYLELFERIEEMVKDKMDGKFETRPAKGHSMAYFHAEDFFNILYNMAKHSKQPMLTYYQSMFYDVQKLKLPFEKIAKSQPVLPEEMKLLEKFIEEGMKLNFVPDPTSDS